MPLSSPPAGEELSAGWSPTLWCVQGSPCGLDACCSWGYTGGFMKQGETCLAHKLLISLWAATQLPAVEFKPWWDPAAKGMTVWDTPSPGKEQVSLPEGHGKTSTQSVAGRVFIPQRLPLGWICWLLCGSEGPEPRLQPSMRLSPTPPTHVHRRRLMNYQHTLKTLQPTSRNHIPVCLLPRRFEGPKPRISKSRDFHSLPLPQAGELLGRVWKH
jgi:hypothetical protein